jgi:HAD superfamily hydrolase (TIGR01509 family)
MMEHKCIIFDSDGVLVDSEAISARVLQIMAAELGFNLDYQTALDRFAGTSMKENKQFVESHIPGALPADFEQVFRERSYEAYKSELKAVPGIHELIEKLPVPFCVASSGPAEKIRLNLGLVGLLDLFEGKIYSCYDIGSWKPEPEIYLHAAREMGFEPNQCAVIEDSDSGVRAAIAGGFPVYVRTDHKKKASFEQMGAIPFQEMKELEVLLGLD